VISTTIGQFALRVLVALALGSLIGAERQYRQRMAGLRTNALVSLGAALFVMLSDLDGRGDPTRIAAQVVSGIGFLAGAVIFREGFSVQGLNTAATMWATAAVGALVGAGFLPQAAIGAAGVLAVHVVLRPMAQRINRRPTSESEMLSAFEIRALCRDEVEERVRTALIAEVRKSALMLHAVYSELVDGRLGTNEVVADVTATGNVDAALERVVTKLGLEPGVNGVSWRIVPPSSDEETVAPDA
jgi:putative Mg2+ transporter-C (MgtC) family protein